MRYLAQILFIILLVTIGEQTVSACSCGEISTRKQFRSANSVFVGQVVTIKTGSNLDAARDGDLYVAIFNVLQTCKGPSRGEFPVYFDPGLFGCSVNFQEGEKYLVYASHKGEFFFDAFCSRTSPVSDASKDSRRLNRFWYRLFACIFPF